MYFKIFGLWIYCKFVQVFTMEIYKNPRNTDNNAMITYAALLCYEVFSSPLHSQQLTISTQFTLLVSALITQGYVYSASPDGDKHCLSGTPSLSPREMSQGSQSCLNGRNRDTILLMRFRFVRVPSFARESLRLRYCLFFRESRNFFNWTNLNVGIHNADCYYKL